MFFPNDMLLEVLTWGFMGLTGCIVIWAIFGKTPGQRK